MNSIALREATPEDVGSIEQLYFDTVNYINSKDYDEKEVKVWSESAYDTKLWNQKINEQYFLVAEVNSEITGFASIAEDGYIDYIYIHKDFQRQGIAKKLLEAIEEKGIEQKNEKLYSLVSKTAKGFFERSGFRQVGRYYDPYKGAKFVNSIMVKWLIG